MRGVRASRQSGVRFRHLPAIRATRNFEIDGCNQSYSAAGAGEVDRRSDERQRSSALHSRKTRTRKIYSGWPPGIACAFWFEPIKCVAAGGPRAVVESG